MTQASIPYVRRFKATDFASRDGNPDFEKNVIAGIRTPHRFVMLFTDELRPIETANLYLWDRTYRPRRNSTWQNTQSAYADDLAQFWTYLFCNNIQWDDVTEEVIEDFEDRLHLAISVVTGRRFRPATIVRRVGTVEEFYRWAHEEGLLPAPVILRSRGERKKRRTRLTPQDETVHAFAHADIATVLNALGPSPWDRDPNDPRPYRNRLAAEVALYSGLRVAEVCGLNMLQILALKKHISPKTPWKMLAIKVEITKGDLPRTASIPSKIIEALLDYIENERAEVIDRAISLGRRVPYNLFLNGLQCNSRDVGNSLSSQTLTRVFTETVKTCGLTSQSLINVIDPSTGGPMIDPKTNALIQTETAIPKHTFHDLRHTFAVNYYQSEIRQGNPSPWKKLQTRLGHRRLSTTVDTYLKHVEVNEPSISDNFARYLKEQLDEIS